MTGLAEYPWGAEALIQCIISFLSQFFLHRDTTSTVHNQRGPEGQGFTSRRALEVSHLKLVTVRAWVRSMKT